MCPIWNEETVSAVIRVPARAVRLYGIMVLSLCVIYDETI